MTVTRDVLRMWLLALLGGLFVLVGSQVVTEGPLLRAAAEAIYPAEVPDYEWRDLIWGWMFLLGGMAVTLWALKEVVWPKRLLSADGEGVCLALSGPFRPPVCLPWKEVMEVGTGPGGTLRLVVKDPDRLLARPWGGRWLDRWTLVVTASDWAPPPGEVAGLVEAMRRAHQPAPDGSGVEEEDSHP